MEVDKTERAKLREDRISAWKERGRTVVTTVSRQIEVTTALPAEVRERMAKLPQGGGR